MIDNLTRKKMAILINHLFGLVAQSGERQPVTLEVVRSKLIRVARKLWAYKTKNPQSSKF